jgi:hypothetical protein
MTLQSRQSSHAKPQVGVSLRTDLRVDPFFFSQIFPATLACRESRESPFPKTPDVM